MAPKHKRTMNGNFSLESNWVMCGVKCAWKYRNKGKQKQKKKKKLKWSASDVQGRYSRKRSTRGREKGNLVPRVQNRQEKAIVELEGSSMPRSGKDTAK